MKLSKLSVRMHNAWPFKWHPLFELNKAINRAISNYLRKAIGKM